MMANRAKANSVWGWQPHHSRYLATESDDQRNTKPQDEGDGSQPGAGQMSAQRTNQDTPECQSAVLVSWLKHVTWRRMIEAEMKTTGKTWEELKTTSKDREQWKSLDSAVCATWVQRGSLTCAEVFLTSNH